MRIFVCQIDWLLYIILRDQFKWLDQSTKLDFIDYMRWETIEFGGYFPKAERVFDHAKRDYDSGKPIQELRASA